MKASFRVAVGFILALGAGAAQATLLWSNMPTTGGGQAGVNTTGSNAAMGFFVPAGGDYWLDSLTLTLSNASGDTPLVRLFSDSGTNPSTALMTFTSPALTSNAILNYIFTPSVNTLLSASTNYWIVVQSGAGSFNWVRNNPSTEPAGVFSYIGTRFNGNPPTTPTDFKYGIEIAGSLASATAVPVPATALLLLVGLAAMSLRTGRRS